MKRLRKKPLRHIPECAGCMYLCGLTSAEINERLGYVNAVQNLRIRLGSERVPLRKGGGSNHYGIQTDGPTSAARVSHRVGFKESRRLNFDTLSLIEDVRRAYHHMERRPLSFWKLQKIFPKDNLVLLY